MEAVSAASRRFLLFIVLNFVALQFSHCSVTYDRKALIINGHRRILISGSIHYPRSSPDVQKYPSLFQNLAAFLWIKGEFFWMQMWEGLIQKAKDGGLDAIDTYVFWDLHEPSPGNVCFFFSHIVWNFGDCFICVERWIDVV